MKLNINTYAVVRHTNKLEKVHKSAFPLAVRGALNKAAFDMKQKTILKSADKAFVKRQPNFFKANSRVEMAKGWDVDKMQSMVGMTSKKLKGGSNNYAVNNLEQQERGGVIGGRSFIPTKEARIGNNPNKNVRPINRISKIKNIIAAKEQKGKNKKEKSVVAAVKGKLTNSPVLYKGVLLKIDSVVSKRKGERTLIKATPLYSVKAGRSVKVSPTNFVKRAAHESGLKIEKFYIDEAERQFKRLKLK